jgi:diacylglycerol kinase (ATP)
MLRLAAAFQNSRRALIRSFREEAALRLEMLLLAAGLPLAVLLTDEAFHRAALIGSLLLLLAVELLNTAIERLCDRLHPERDPAIGYVKDLGSAAVLAAIMIVAILWLAALWRFADRYI